MVAHTRGRPLKNFFARLLSWFPLYRAVVGAHRYYSTTEEQNHRPEDFLFFGPGANICTGAIITAPERMSVGCGSFIACDCLIYAVGGFHLGNYSGLGSRSIVLTVDHRHAGATTIPFDEVRIVKPVHIEDYVWVGMQAAILPGVRIGEGAIVGLGSVVTKDVPACAIVMGNPAQIIGHRDRSDFERLKAAGAVRPVSQNTSRLWIPPYIRRKHPEDLAAFGFGDQDYYNYRRRNHT